jgi:hypothetical protein
MKTLWIAGCLMTAGLLVTGCGNGSSAAKKTFGVTLTNVTHQQPMSPVAVALHMKSYRLFAIGSPASTGLERLAEGGDNALLLQEVNATAAVVAVTGGSAPIPPGGSETVMLEGKKGDCISLATMLVNTNDAFAAASCIDITALAEGEKMTVSIVAYDAGTEANSETASSVPGPAGGGEGYNAARDDRNFVAVHGGVITADDGLPTSALTEAHRWDNPVAVLTVTRLD